MTAKAGQYIANLIPEYPAVNVTFEASRALNSIKNTGEYVINKAKENPSATATFEASSRALNSIKNTGGHVISRVKENPGAAATYAASKALDGAKNAGGYVVNKAKENPGATTVVATAAIGVLVGPPVVAFAVNSLGFQSGGIAAGSWAAQIMASYGGIVPAGSACATLQSIGAAGTGVVTTYLCGSGGAAVGALGRSFYKKHNDTDQPEIKPKI